jgi:[ribosomal protein S18]-alanine N-acetyltransferase
METNGQLNSEERLTLMSATGADLSELFLLETLCEDRPWTKENIASELADRHALHFLLRTADGRRACSFVLARLIADELHIHKVTTHPDFRRQGHAKQLLGHVLTRAKERGGKRALLEVRSGNEAAIRLYMSLGFVTDAVRKKYYVSGEDALMMSREL